MDPQFRIRVYTTAKSPYYNNKNKTHHSGSKLFSRKVSVSVFLNGEQMDPCEVFWFPCFHIF